jgi:predicted nucleic acid-binding Zn ribbon protein
MQGIKARKLRKCPVCGTHALKREITGGGGFILRGSGFYCNDYPKKKDKNNS